MNETSPEPVDLPEDLIHLVKPELQPGERLLWAAAARPRPPFLGKRPWSASFVAMACLILSIGLFLGLIGPTRHLLLFAESFVNLVVVISAVVGLVAGIIAIAIWINRQSCRGRPSTNTYALTDRRAILWVPRQFLGAMEVHTVARGTVKAIHRLEYPDGSGDVKFDYPGEEYYGPGGLHGVADVRLVEDLARRTLIDPGPFAST
jgi:hypothetical protein